MTTEQIEKYIEQGKHSENPLNHSHLEEWKQTKNLNLSRIFNGMSFTRLSDDK